MSELSYPYVSPNDDTLRFIKDDIIFYIRKDIEFSFPFERHDGYEIYLFLEGDAQIFVEQNCYSLSRGDLYMIFPEEYHRIQALSTTTYDRAVIHLSSSYINRLSSSQTNLNTAFFIKEGASFNIAHLSETDIKEFMHAVNRIKHYNGSDEFGSDLLKDAYCTTFLLRLYHRFQDEKSAQRNLTPPLVEQAIEYIQTHLSENITIDELSHALYHDRSYISRLFKDFTGITLQQYIIIKKVTLAKQLLSKGYSLTDVCFQSGFHNYANFIRTFSKNTGISPAKYQKSNIENVQEPSKL